MKIACLGIAAAFLWGAATAAAASAASATPEEIQQILQARVAAQPQTGIILGVIDNGKVTVYKAGSSGTARPLDEHTLFEIGSVTKTFTTTVLAELVMQGKVHLDDPVSRYLPPSASVPSKDGKRITLLTLATQHSGLPRVPDDLNATSDDPYADYTPEKLLAFLRSYKLTRDPGAEFEYSNLGMGLLGFALSREQHADYESMVRERVWRPLGMNETTIALNAAQRARFAQGHDDSGATVHSWEFTDALAGAGAIRSDLTDMLKYLRAAMGEGPLGKTLLFAEQPRATFEGHHIGLAWWINDVSHFIDHGGDTAGYHSVVLMSGDRRMGVVMLSNGPQVVDIAAHVLNTAYALAPEPRLVTLSEATLDEYAGKYVNTSAGLEYHVERSGAVLKAQLSGQQSVAVYASRPDHFYYKVVQAYLEFVRQGGKVVGVILTQNGQHLPFYKVDAEGKQLATEIQPAYPPVASLDTATLESYAGTYATQGVRNVVSVENGHVFSKIGSQSAIELYPSAKDEFYVKDVDAQVHFARDAQGTVTSLTISQNGIEITYPKLH